MNRSELSIGRSAVAGTAAYLLGYLLTYVWQVNGVRDAISGLNVLLQLVGAERIPAWTAVGWLFYGAHFVPLHIPTPGPSEVVRSIVGNGGATELLYVLPPVVLIVAGAAAAAWTGVRGVDSGALAGAAVATAYLVLAVVGAFVFRFSVESLVVQPDLLRSVVLAGVVYPVAFGAIGGALYGATR